MELMTSLIKISGSGIGVSTCLRAYKAIFLLVCKRSTYVGTCSQMCITHMGFAEVSLMFSCVSFCWYEGSSTYSWNVHICICVCLKWIVCVNLLRVCLFVHVCLFLFVYVCHICFSKKEYTPLVKTYTSSIPFSGRPCLDYPILQRDLAYLSYTFTCL